MLRHSIAYLIHSIQRTISQLFLLLQGSFLEVYVYVFQMLVQLCRFARLCGEFCKVMQDLHCISMQGHVASLEGQGSRSGPPKAPCSVSPHRQGTRTPCQPSQTGDQDTMSALTDRGQDTNPCHPIHSHSSYLLWFSSNFSVFFNVAADVLQSKQITKTSKPNILCLFALQLIANTALHWMKKTKMMMVTESALPSKQLEVGVLWAAEPWCEGGA